MLAVVLVGGEGTRLRPLTYYEPKPLLPIVERPIIVRVVEWLARHGITEVVLSLAYQPDAFVAAFPDSTCAGLPLRYAIEPPSGLDTAGAIAFAAREAGISPRDGEPFVVVNGDILTDLELNSLVKLHRERAAEATIALTPVEDPSAYGVVPTDDDGRVLAFIEKPARESAPTNLINAGTYVVEPRLLERVEPGRRVSIEREVFPAVVADGALFAMASSTYWIDTGTPDRFLQAQLDVLQGRREAVSLPPAEEVTPGVHLAAGAEAAGEVTGCAFLAAGARLRAGASLADSVLGAGAAIAPGASVARSVLFARVDVAGGASVDSSLIGPGARIGAGAQLSEGTVIGAGVEVPEGARLAGARVPS
jgi:mannose-1-phosphate guanylyltransferase